MNYSIPQRQECLGCGEYVWLYEWFKHSQACVKLEKVVFNMLNVELSLEGFEHEAE